MSRTRFRTDGFPFSRVLTFVSRDDCSFLLFYLAAMKDPIQSTSELFGNGIPWSFGTDEDVKGWTNAGIIDEDAQADMSEFAIAHDRKEPRATMPAKV